MFFVSNEHEQNYKKMVLLFPEARKTPPNTEYQVACYVISYPGLFDIHQGKPGDHPFTWYLGNKNELQIPLPYKALIELGIHLYGGGIHDFNLLRSLSYWSHDTDLVNVFFQALAIRQGWIEKQQKSI